MRFYRSYEIIFVDFFILTWDTEKHLKFVSYIHRKQFVQCTCNPLKIEYGNVFSEDAPDSRIPIEYVSVTHGSNGSGVSKPMTVAVFLNVLLALATRR